MRNYLIVFFLIRTEKTSRMEQDPFLSDMARTHEDKCLFYDLKDPRECFFKMNFLTMAQKTRRVYF